MDPPPPPPIKKFLDPSLSFLGSMPNIIMFFLLPSLKNGVLVLRFEVAPAYRVIKMLKMDYLGLYTPHRLLQSMPQLLQSVIRKKQRGRDKY